MATESNKTDSPGVYIPPPLFYILVFIAAVFIQQKISIAEALFQSLTIKIVGIVLLIIALFFLVRSLRQFFQSKKHFNTY